MMDLEKFRNNDNIQKQLKEGLVFIMDYNEDRQTWSDDGSQGSYDRNGLFERIEISNDNAGSFIYIDTIGLLNLICSIYRQYTIALAFNKVKQYVWHNMYIKCFVHQTIDIVDF